MTKVKILNMNGEYIGDTEEVENEYDYNLLISAEYSYIQENRGYLKLGESKTKTITNDLGELVTISYYDGVILDVEKQTELVNQQKLDNYIDLKVLDIQHKLNELGYDITQHNAGLLVTNIEEKKQEYMTLHDELRRLKGLEPRERQ